jgi:hypothetical protein
MTEPYDIADLIKARRTIQEFNRAANACDLEGMTFVNDGEPVELDPDVVSEWVFTGLGWETFFTAGYYLQKGDSER